MSESEKADRRSRIVMALGIATVILFSANLLAMVAKHFWPDLRETALFRSETAKEEVAEVQEHVFEFHSFADADHKRHRYRVRRPSRIIIQKPHVVSGAITLEHGKMSQKLQELRHELDLRANTIRQHKLDSNLDRELLELEDRLHALQRDLNGELELSELGSNGNFSIKFKSSSDGSGTTTRVYTLNGEELEADVRAEEAARRAQELSATYRAAIQAADIAAERKQDVEDQQDQ